MVSPQLRCPKPLQCLKPPQPQPLRPRLLPQQQVPLQRHQALDPQLLGAAPGRMDQARVIRLSNLIMLGAMQIRPIAKGIATAHG